MMNTLTRHGAKALLALAFACLPTAQASAQQARITNLSDIDFGDVGGALSDVSDAQNLCVYASGASYSITATGSGNGGAFVLRNGSRTLPYQVQWGFGSGMTSGLALQPGQPRNGDITGLSNLFCYFGWGSSASLIVTLRSSDIGTAAAGNYSGTLTLMVAPQ